MSAPYRMSEKLRQALEDLSAAMAADDWTSSRDRLRRILGYHVAPDGEQFDTLDKMDEHTARARAALNEKYRAEGHWWAR